MASATSFIEGVRAGLTLPRLLVLGFTIIYTAIAGYIFYQNGNAEFLGYVAFIMLLIAVGGCILAHACAPAWLLWLISILGLMHMLGASVEIGGDILYNYVPFPIENPTGLTFIKYDQIVHSYGSAVAAFLVHFFVAPKTHMSTFGLAVVVILAAIGIGAINEVVEFYAKLTVPDSDVGGYYNTAVDLVVNLIGAIVGAVLAARFWKHAA